MTIHMTYEELILVTAWMAENDRSADEVARVVEKPWNYKSELAVAKMESGHRGTLHEQVDELWREFDLGVLSSETDQERNRTAVRVWGKVNSMSESLKDVTEHEVIEIEAVRDRIDDLMARIMRDGFRLDPDTGASLRKRVAG